jgi:hypothetical protein
MHDCLRCRTTAIRVLIVPTLTGRPEHIRIRKAMVSMLVLHHPSEEFSVTPSIVSSDCIRAF